MKEILYGTLDPDSVDTSYRGDVYFAAVNDMYGEDLLYDAAERFAGKNVKITIEEI